MRCKWDCVIVLLRRINKELGNFKNRFWGLMVKLFESDSWFFFIKLFLNGEEDLNNFVWKM